QDSDGDGLPDRWEDDKGLDSSDCADGAADRDHDDLSNLQEYLYGTDMEDPDSDGDGMDDGWEVSYQLDPLNPGDASQDNDKDSYSNLEEFQAGSDPLDSEDIPKENILPQAIPQVSVTTLVEGEEVTFDGTKSVDSDGEIVGFLWRDGDTILSESSSFVTDQLRAGTHRIELTVTDNRGGMNTKSIIVTVLPENLSEAVEITEINKRVSSSIVNEQQWYKVYLKRGEGYTIVLEPHINDGTMGVYLYEPDGSTRITYDYSIYDGEMGKLRLTAATSGYYYINVTRRGALSGNYHLSVYPAYWNIGYSDEEVSYNGDSYQAHYLHSGQVAVEGSGRDNWLRFEGKAGQSYTLTFRPHLGKEYRGMNIYLYQKGDGSTLSSVTAYEREDGTGYSITFDAAVDNVYYLKLDSSYPGSVDITALEVEPDSDADGDGLSATQEYMIGTDPDKADTDGDGVDDKEEFSQGEDPLAP
ncbi:MAG: PKD domain-containing protein, partial [Thermotogae bacterium]|nr:PKD domain-containing protein [Thermotogota bacterium]